MNVSTLEMGRPEAAVRSGRTVSLVAAWALVLVAAEVVGVAYVAAHDTPLAVGAVPWVGRWGLEFDSVGRLVVAAGAAAAAVWFLPVVAFRARWRAVLVGAGATAAALALVLVWAGPSWTHWQSIEFGYGQHTGMVDAAGPGGYLDRYVEVQPGLAGHLRAHPPGFVLLLWSAGHLGMSGTGFHLALMLAAGAVATVAALVMFREVAGEELGRAAAPFAAIAPVLVWRTNPDVVFGAVALVGVALAVVATGRSGRRSDGLAVAGGLVFALALMCTYGVQLLAIPMVAVAVHRRSLRPVALAALGCLAGLALPALWGFWWPAGLLETRVQYERSISRSRGYAYWLLGNAATFLALIGPASVVGLARLRARSARVLVFAGASCAVLAGLSGLSSAETERIWQPFAPLVLLAGAALWLRAGRFDLRAARVWLTVQAGVALAFQAALQSPW